MRSRNLFITILLGLSPTLWLLPSLATASPHIVPSDLTTLSQAIFTATLGAEADNTLYEEVDGALSNSAGEYFFVGRTDQITNSIRRGLIRFDVAGNIPAGSTIVSAALYLTMSKTLAGPQSIELHRVTADWGEGASDAGFEEGAGIMSTLNDATWVHTFYSSTQWSTPGGDFVVTASATTTVDGNAAYSWSASDVVSDVQAWLDTPATNYGWLLLGNETAPATAKRFNTQDHTSTDTRPLLLITYVPPYAVYLPIIIR